MRLVTAGIAAFAALTAALPAAGDARPNWRVVEATGAFMFASDDARCLAIDPRRDLPVGAVVETGKGGNVTLMRGEDSVVVSPQSRLTLLPDRGVETRVAHDAGMAWFKIGKKSKPHFSVRTRELTATVKGTTFTVAIDATGAAVHVREGAVEVATDWRDAVTLVKAGTMARVRRAAPDRITLMNGGNVVRTVTGFDTSAAAPGALRLGAGDAPGVLLAPAASSGGAEGSRAIGPAVWTHQAAASPASPKRARGTGLAPKAPAPTTQRTTAPTPIAAVGAREAPSASTKASRRTSSRLPLLETMLAALALLIIMVARTFFGGRQTKAVRIDDRRG
jgi:hypothetical protein